MDQSKALEIGNAVMPLLKEAFAFCQWHIDFRVERLEGSDEDSAAAGYCNADPKYHRALMRFDYEEAEEDELKRTMRHEMCHVLHAPFQTYRRAVAQIVDDEQMAVLDEIFQLASEHTVHQIERMLDFGIGLSVDAMIEAARCDEDEDDG